ncbi:MAG TPA: histone H1 [Phycisphaerales bacterium]|nr:histone H1 [Phycisphaerales bacterium]
MESFEKLKQAVVQAEDDIAKAEGGNKAAGTRARKALQDVRNLAQEIRKEILTLRDQPSS